MGRMARGRTGSSAERHGRSGSRAGSSPRCWSQHGRPARSSRTYPRASEEGSRAAVAPSRTVPGVGSGIERNTGAALEPTGARLRKRPLDLSWEVSF